MTVHKLIQTIVGAMLAVVSFGVLAQVALPVERPTLSVGDSWKYQRTDMWKKEVLPHQSVVRVAEILPAGGYRFEGTNFLGTNIRFSSDVDLNRAPYRVSGEDQFQKWFKWPASKELAWEFRYKLIWNNGAIGTHDARCEIKGLEKVKVPAGEFDTVLIACKWFGSGDNGGSGSGDEMSWYSPVAKRVVKSISKWWDRGRLQDQWLDELVEYCVVDACRVKTQAAGAAEMGFVTLSEGEITALVGGKKISFNSPQYGRCHVSYANDNKATWQCAGGTGTGTGAYRIGRFTPQGAADDKSPIRLCTVSIAPIVPSDCTVLYKRQDGTYWGWNKVMQLAIADI